MMKRVAVSIGSNSDDVSQILPAADSALTRVDNCAAGVHVLLDDGPSRVTARSHILNDFIEINCAGTEFAEYTAPYRLKKADAISARGLQDWKLYILQVKVPNT